MCYRFPCFDVCADLLVFSECVTLPETNMETQKGPDKDYSPSKMGLYGLAC